MYQEYGDRAGFLFVYIREAHPADEWQMDANVKDGVVINQPRTQVERAAAASDACSALKLTMPAVVDTLDDNVDNLYAGWPERLFVVDADGKIAYAGSRGPWGFKPEEVEAWLTRNVGR